MSWTLTLPGWSGPTLHVVDVGVGRDAQSQLPAPVRDPVGATVGGGTIAARGPVSPWDQATLVGEQFALSWAGTEVMSGTVVEVDGAASSQDVTLRVVDVTGALVGAAYQLPTVAEGSGGHQPGMHGQWVTEHLLAQFGLSPYQDSRDGAHVFVSAAGSLEPDMDETARLFASAGDGGGGQPTFTLGPWGLGVDVGDVSVTTVLNGADDMVRVMAAVDWDVNPQFSVSWEGEVSHGFDVTVTFDGTASPPTYQVSGSWGSDPAPSDLPGVSGAGFVTVDFRTVSSGGAIPFDVVADIWWGGVKVVDGHSVFSHPEALLVARDVGVAVTSGPVSGVSWRTIDDAAGDPPVAPAGDLGDFGSPCLLSRPPGTPDTAWETIRHVAAASGGTIWAAGDGTIAAVGPADLATAEPTVTLSGHLVEDVAWAEQDTLRASAVEVGFLPVVADVIGAGGIVLQQLSSNGYKPGKRRTFHVDLPGAATVDERRRRVDLYDGDDIDTATQIAGAVVTATQVDADRVRLQVDNVSKKTGFPQLTVWLAPWATTVWTVEDATSAVEDTGGTGDTYVAPDSVFRQDHTAAAAVGNRLAADLADPPPEIGQLAVTDPDLTLDVGSVVEFTEPLFTGAYSRRAMVVAAGWAGLHAQTVGLRGLRDSVAFVDVTVDGRPISDVDTALAAETVGSVDADPAAHFQGVA